MIDSLTKEAILRINPNFFSKKWQYKLMYPLLFLSSRSFHKLFGDGNNDIEFIASELRFSDFIVHLWILECLINEAVIYFCF